MLIVEYFFSSLLGQIRDSSYDFILSSHSLEHTANPVKALKEWIRVMRPGGALILILPNYKKIVDRRRTPTTVEHMFDDFAQDSDETDLTHLEEVLRYHRGADEEENRLREELHWDNFKHRIMHHHVFDEHNSRTLLEKCGLAVPIVERVWPHHIVILAQRSR